MTRNTLCTLGGILAIALWSATFALARSLSEQVGAITAATAVYLGGGVFCLARLLSSRAWRGRLTTLPRISWRWAGGLSYAIHLTVCGSLFCLYTVLIYLAVGMARSREQLLEIALLNYLWPALTILLSVVLLKRRASLLLVPGTALALSGVFLVMTQGAQVSWGSLLSHFQANPIAYSLALGAAVSWALYSNLTRRWSEPGRDGAVELFIPATGLILLGVRLFLVERTEWSAQALLEAGVLGGVTALAYVLWEAAMREGDLLMVAACAYFTPLLSTMVSCAYLKVLPGSRLWVGCGLIVVGSLVSWRSSGADPDQKQLSNGSPEL